MFSNKLISACKNGDSKVGREKQMDKQRTKCVK